MNSTMKELIRLLRDEKASKETILKEEVQDVSNEDYTQETELVNDTDPATQEEVAEEEELIEDPSLFMDPDLNFESSTIEQKKIMLIDYFSKIINKIMVIRDHIDSLSFDSIVSSNMVISATQLQFNLEELKEKVSKYIEDQYESDRYERSLYVYLSFMEELKLIVKLLHKQTKKLE